MKTDEKILTTARQLFNENGYVQTGMREIARKLNISPGNLSYHFPKKEDILFRILEDFAWVNTQYYEAYFDGEATNEHFLALMKNVFHNQFNNRGVYIGNQVVQQALRDTSRFNYTANAKRRVETFKSIYEGLSLTGHLNIDATEVNFLVSFTTLFGRFWIAEALLDRQNLNINKTVRHYIEVFAKELSLFSTKKGLQSIEWFRKKNL